MEYHKQRFTRNLSMLADFYEFTMASGYVETGHADQICVFDMFFRSVPDDGGYAIAAGLEQLIEYLENLSFTEEDVAYLRGKKLFPERFLQYLLDFKFHCNLWAIPEGTPIFPGEPIITVEGPAPEAQLIETALLNFVNHQSLIATKASRIVRAAAGKPVSEFGARRAQGADAAILGARAAYIGGVAGTSCVPTEMAFGVPAGGTMAHSWIQMYDTEYDAFKAYAQLYPENCLLLVDTYSVLKSGVPNAIKVFDEVLKPLGVRPRGIRLDSGDIAYQSKRARKMLDDAGYPDAVIFASNSLDEYILADLRLQGAKLDAYGIGEKLITSKTSPVFTGVYKLAAVKKEGKYIPKIKIGESAEKLTNPNLKRLWRMYDNATGKAMADYITLWDEDPSGEKSLTLFDPLETWKRRTFTDFTLKELQVPIFAEGKRVYQSPTLAEIKAYCAAQLETLWEETLRLENPHKYYVDLSDKLWAQRQQLLETLSAEHR